MLVLITICKHCIFYTDHGGWSEWGSWEPCSVTCGGGTTHKRRFCNNPLPDLDGRPCEGTDVVVDSCGHEQCPC